MEEKIVTVLNEMAEYLSISQMKQKMIFTKSKEYYIHRIRRFWGTGEISFHSFRYYRRKLEMGITIGIQVPKVIPV